MIELTGDFICHLDIQGLSQPENEAQKSILLRDVSGILLGSLQGMDGLVKDVYSLDASFGDCEVHWDGCARRLVLMRNAVGRETVYVRIQGSRLLLSSRLPLMSSWGGIESQIDEVAIADFWRFGRILPPRTIFKDICHLRPGSVLTLSAVAGGWQMAETLLPWSEETKPRITGIFGVRELIPLSAFAAEDRPDQHPEGAFLGKDRLGVFNEIAHITQVLGQPVGESGLALLSLLFRRRRSKASFFINVNGGLSPTALVLRRRWMQRIMRESERRRCEDIWNAERLFDLKHASTAAGILKLNPAQDGAIDSMAASLILPERRLDLSTLARAFGQSVSFVSSIAPFAMTVDQFQTQQVFPDDAEEACNLVCQAVALFHRRGMGADAPFIRRLHLDPFRMNSVRKAATEVDRFVLDQSLMGVLSLCHLARFHHVLPQPVFSWIDLVGRPTSLSPFSTFKS